MSRVDRRALVEQIVSDTVGRRAGVRDVRARPGMYSSSFSTEDLDVRLDDGTELALVLKDLSPGGMLRDARRVKPPFLYDPLREIATYRHVLGPHGVEAPALWGNHVDEASQCYLLLVERISGRPLWQEGKIDTWCDVARWLAAMHRRLADRTDSFVGPARLICYDAHYYGQWARRASEALKDNASSAGLIDRYLRAVERLLRLPLTFIHGEFHASNVVIEPSPGGSRVRPVDWEMAAKGPGLMDLADLTAGNWTPGQRDAIVDAYRAATIEVGGVVGDRFDVDLDYCRLHRAVQWVAWADEWVPPREHRQDWLAEALRLGERLGLP